MTTFLLNSVFSGCNPVFFRRYTPFTRITALLLLTWPVSGQVLDWVNHPVAALPFGGDEMGKAIVRDASGNVYVTGYFYDTADFDPGAGTVNLSGAGSFDIFIAKYDASGNYVWAKQIGGTADDRGSAIAVDGSGNVYITGQFSGAVDFDPGAGTANLVTSGDEDIFIAKYDASGNYVWAKQIGGPSDFSIYSHSIAVDGIGNTHITGYFLGKNVDFDPGAGTANLGSTSNQYMFLAKYDAFGNYVWAKEVGGAADQFVYGYAIALDGSGNVHVTGSFEGFVVDFDPGPGTANMFADIGNTDIFIAKYDASGNYVWAKQVSGTGISNETGYGIAVDGSGNVHITGYFQDNNVDFDPGAGTAPLSSAGISDIFLAKYDASGNYLWAKQMGGIHYDQAYGIALDGSDNVYITGYFYGTVDFDPGAGTANLNSTFFEEIFIAKYDASGNYVWAKQVYGMLNDAGAGIAVDGSGNTFITGYFQSNNVDFDPGAGTANLNAGIDNKDAFVLCLSSAGNYQWAINIGKYGSKPNYMECRSIASDALGNVYATGLFEGSNVDFDPGAGTANLSSAGAEDVFIAKYDASGHCIWAIRAGGEFADMGYDIAVDGSGNVYVSGGFKSANVDFNPGAGTANLSSTGGYDNFIAKYDVSGNYVWVRQIAGPGDDYTPGIAVDGSGNVFFTGHFYGTADFDPGAGTANLSSAGFSDIFLAKFDAAGNYTWAKRVGGPDFEGSNDIAVDGSGNVHITGYFQGNNVDFDPEAGVANLSSTGYSDIFIAKYDASGNYIWAKQAGGTGFESGNGIALDGNGNVHITGNFPGVVDFDPGAGTANLSSAGDKDIFLAKYDASGNYLWAKGAGGTYADMANDIVVDGNGSVHITGYFYWTVDFDPGAGTANLSSAGSTDIFHAKYSASGNYESAIKLGSTNVDRGYCVSTGGNGRIYLGGSFSGTLDFDPGPGTATRMAVSYGDIFIAQYGPIAVSGAVIWEHDDVSGVNNATVNLTGSATGSDQTDNNGQFLITTGLSGGSFTLKPLKNLNKFNGVNAGDVTAIQQHVGNAVPIADNYKKVCADINKSNSITSLDASILNQALLGNPAANAIFNTSWRFVPSNHVLGNPPWGFPEQRTYTNIFTSQTGQDFIGMKIGDVTTVYANPANFGNGEPLVLLGKDRVLQAGETFTLEINAEPLNDLAAFQCAMRFDPDQLQFIDIQPLTALPLAADNFGTYNIAGGEIRLVWAQATGMAIPEAAPVFKLTFTAQQSGGKLSEVFELDESELAALAFTGALNESKVELQFSDLTATHNPAGANGVQLFQNRPNPFSGTTAIGFVLPEACEVQLRVFDVSGSMLAEHKGQYPAGKNEERFELNATTGLLYYELTTPFGVLAKKMVAGR